MMNTTVFTDPEVGHFFNEHFINVKFDMEKGEGRELLKRYGMQVFPTYLLLDAAGNEVHRVVGGHDAGEFIRLIREGMIKFRPYWMSFAGKMERRLTKRTGS